MPINAGHEYMNSEKEYLNAKTIEDKIFWTEEMIKTAPKHKGSENLLKGLKTRLKKFKESAEKAGRKSGGRKGIRKEGFQFVMVGKTNVGRSALLSRLTNATPRVADHGFTTREPVLGTFFYQGVSAQVVGNPSIGGENFDVGLANNADCVIVVVTSFEEIAAVEEYLQRARGKRIFVLNKIDMFSAEEMRKLRDRARSKKLDIVFVSSFSGEGLEELRERMFLEIGAVRIYLKEPGKEKQTAPMVLSPGATIKDVAEDILKGFSTRVKETRISGPSAKFRNQRVGLAHVVKDGDVVEFHTR